MGFLEWTAVLGNVGEFVGAIAVVVTLGYLAVQVRHSKDALDANTTSVRAQIAQARADNLTANYRALMDSPHLPAIMSKRRDFRDDQAWVASLSPEERWRMRYYVFLQGNDIRNQFYQYQQGVLDESIWSTSTRAQIVRMLQLRHLFVPVAERHDPRYKEVLDDIAREHGLPPIDDSGVGIAPDVDLARAQASETRPSE